MEQHQQRATIFADSRLAAGLSCAATAFAAAWRDSAARRAARPVVASLGDRTSGAATLAVAAVVALGAQQLRASHEPGLWILPASVLAWAVVTLLRPRSS